MLANDLETRTPSRPLPAPADGQSISPVAAEILERAQARAVAEGLAYSGSVSPEEAWLLYSQGLAQIVDIRTAEELRLVGRVPDIPHVAWATGLSMNRNPRFLRELEAKAAKTEPVLLLCRSGKRSHAAAEAAAKAGFRQVFNITEGFEGDLDEQQRRGQLGGWRLRGLPWIQD